MYPIKKAQLMEALDTIGPLCRVIVEEVQEEKVTEE
jgi:hypothetical protein